MKGKCFPAEAQPSWKLAAAAENQFHEVSLNVPNCSLFFANEIGTYSSDSKIYSSYI